MVRFAVLNGVAYDNFKIASAAKAEICMAFDFEPSPVILAFDGGRQHFNSDVTALRVRDSSDPAIFEKIK